MSHLVSTLVLESDASPPVKEIYKEIKNAFDVDFIPNFFKTQANSLPLLKTTWSMVSQILLKDSVLTRLEKEVIFTSVSGSKNCTYCKSAHIAFCCSLGIRSAVYYLLVSNKFDAILPNDLRAMAVFATKVANSPPQISKEDEKKLSDEGIEQEKMYEIIRVAAMSSHCSMLADTLGVQVDKEFEDLINTYECNRKE